MPPVSARVSNIDSSVTKEILFEFFNAKGLLLADGQYIALVSTATGNGNSTVLSFLNEAAYKKALALPRADLILEGKVIQIDDNFEGLTSLSEGNQIDIVAVHGLNGHAFRSWEVHSESKRESFMWLRDSVPLHIPGARVMIYGYNANVFSDVSTGRMRTFAETFLERLRYMRESHADRPLILIAHSMGGLIVKQALLVAHARADRRYDTVLNSVTGVVFLGTPHQGGNGVSTAKFVANFVRAFNVDARVDLIRSLDPSSMVLFDLTDDFRQLVSSKGIDIATLFETKKTNFFIKSVWIVEERSAILGVVRERKAAIDANHTDLCKFKSHSDRSLHAALQVLKELSNEVTPIILRRSQSLQPHPPEDLKYTCLADPEKLDDTPEYPILALGQYTYWALSYTDNRYAMAILAYDGTGKLVGRWTKPGARYIHHIEVDENLRQVSFIGQGNLSVVFPLSELRITSSLRLF